MQTDQQLIDELRLQIQDRTLSIFSCTDLFNIEFLNEFEIEELLIDNCQNFTPKLNSKRIKKLNLFYNRVLNYSQLVLPNLEVLDKRIQIWECVIQFSKTSYNLIVSVYFKNIDMILNILI
ncbi:Hypothetical_protein [Hexamita inflata]|uniref:Hypothetical_protein n=1 Tax=Hexamita inflata TaxID=28002 RepID=A0AA86NBB1_9EUKA|nr:Hypothetical protein HINF_LOCUS3499 [Hexamita inflata]